MQMSAVVIKSCPARNVHLFCFGCRITVCAHHCRFHTLNMPFEICSRYQLQDVAIHPKALTVICMTILIKGCRGRLIVYIHLCAILLFISVNEHVPTLSGGIENITCIVVWYTLQTITDEWTVVYSKLDSPPDVPIVSNLLRKHSLESMFQY